MCNNNRKDPAVKDANGRPKKCTSTLCLKPNPEKIQIIEEKKNKKGKTVFKIDPKTSDDELFKAENYTIYHHHKGRLKNSTELTKMDNRTVPKIAG